MALEGNIWIPQKSNQQMKYMQVLKFIGLGNPCIAAIVSSGQQNWLQTKWSVCFYWYSSFADNRYLISVVFSFVLVHEYLSQATPQALCLSVLPWLNVPLL